MRTNLCYNMSMQRSMVATDAKETLLDLIDELTIALEDLQKQEIRGELDLYGEGAKAVYVQMLEFIRERWEESEANGLDFNIEERFPI